VSKKFSKSNGMKEIAMHKTGRRSFIFPVLAAALLTVGCASQESVEHAQATANSALSSAQQAGQAAQQAQQTATQAQQTADQARSEVTALSQKVDALAQMHAARGPRD
jgi:predicted HAD superfamily Cof-like phosphohydrolase